MAQASIIQEGFDRFEEARRSFEKSYRRIQKRADKRRRDFERSAEKRVRRFRTDLRKNPLVKRVGGLREETTKRVEEQVEQFLATFRIATQSEVSRLERKVAQLNRKVRELERSQAA